MEEWGRSSNSQVLKAILTPHKILLTWVRTPFLKWIPASRILRCIQNQSRISARNLHQFYKRARNSSRLIVNPTKSYHHNSLKRSLGWHSIMMHLFRLFMKSLNTASMMIERTVNCSFLIKSPWARTDSAFTTRKLQTLRGRAISRREIGVHRL